MSTLAMSRCLLIISGINVTKPFRMIHFQVQRQAMRSYQNELSREGFAYNSQGVTHTEI